MSDTLTNKQLLEEIRREQKENAEMMFKNAQMFSNFMNAQESINTKWSIYLETSSTSEGAITKLDRVEKELISLKTSIDKKIAYFTGAGIVVLTVGKWMISKIFV